MIIAQLQSDPIVNLYIKHPVVFDSIQFPWTTAPTAAAAAAAATAACRTIDNRTHLVPLALHRVPGIGESGGANAHYLGLSVFVARRFQGFDAR